jgi:predicted alpha/beta-fold hydrolase
MSAPVVHFKPPRWLQNPHLQTIWPTLFPVEGPSHIWRERITTQDQDFLDLDWSGTLGPHGVLLIHGLSGSSRSPYIQRLQKLLAENGFTVAALNLRGCSGVPNNTANAYHSGETQDLDHVYRLIAPRFQFFSVVGFSLGGNMLLKWLGEQGSAVRLSGAVAVSVPYELARCADRMDSGFSRLYRDLLISELKGFVETKKQHLLAIGHQAEAERMIQLGDLSAIRSFWEYDDRVVAKLYGFRDVQDYYEQSSSRTYLRRIENNALLIHAEDDPFMVPAVIPAGHELGPGVRLEVTSKGGHVGFVEGHWGFRPRYWIDRRILDFLSDH